MGELIHFTITTRNRYISNMNRFVIACIFMAFAAAAASEDTYKERNLFTEPPRSAQTDFLETMMHDGEVPEHFFDTPVAAKKDVAPLYDQESELYESLVQEEVKAAPLYDQESELYASLLQEAAESKGVRIKDRMKSFKAVLRKNKAFKKVLSNAKNAVAKHMGALGALLQDMFIKPKKDQIPVAQYAASMKRLLSLHSHGIWKYTLEHVADAMYGKGLVSLGPISSKDGNFVRIDPRDIGLIRGFPILDTTATYVGVFQKAVSRIAKDVIVDLKDKYMAAPFSKADYKRLFRSTCSGDVKKCFPQVDKKGCDAKSHFGCKWVGEWNGRLAVESMQ